MFGWNDRTLYFSYNSRGKWQVASAPVAHPALTLVDPLEHNDAILRRCALNESMPLSEIWARTFNRVQREVDIPTVWLAMQAVRPIVVDGNRFVATLPPDLRYLSMNLESSDAAHAIESSLEEIMGRPLAFILIEGQTVEDWEAEKAELLGSAPLITFADDDDDMGPEFPVDTSDQLVFKDEEVTSLPPAFTAAPLTTGFQAPANEGFDSWEKLNEYMSHEQKHFPLVRYPHGQARFLLHCARLIAGTMDRMMPGPGQPSDTAQERQLAKSIERLAVGLTLDPLFVSLEIMRYRQLTGRE